MLPNTGRAANMIPTESNDDSFEQSNELVTFDQDNDTVEDDDKLEDAFTAWTELGDLSRRIGKFIIKHKIETVKAKKRQDSNEHEGRRVKRRRVSLHSGDVNLLPPTTLDNEENGVVPVGSVDDQIRRIRLMARLYVDMQRAHNQMKYEIEQMIQERNTEDNLTLTTSAE